jgi:hypothetical protein
MTPEAFIINEIKTLVELFPNVRARYENHQMSNTHFVEVLPNEVYRLNEDFKIWEESVVFTFIEKFPEQNLCFLSDDDVVKIETKYFEAKGKLFELNYSVFDGSYRSVSITNFSFSSLRNAVYPIVVNQPSKVLSKLTGISITTSNGSFSNENNFASLMDVGGPSVENAGENNYSLAA